jgi:hypothetical protein
MTQEDATQNVSDRDDLEEKEYFLRRADQHRQLAELADVSGSKRIHLHLASLYEERADRIGVVDQD